jgi:hypothetical protein
MSAAKQTNVRVFTSAEFQHLAVLFCSNDVVALAYERNTLANMRLIYSRWLAVAGVKSKRAGALKMLRRETWLDPVFRDDMRAYANKVQNQAAIVYLDELDASFASEAADKK